MKNSTKDQCTEIQPPMSKPESEYERLARQRDYIIKKHAQAALENILKYVWIQDDNGIIEDDRPHKGKVLMAYNPEKILEILEGLQ